MVSPKLRRFVLLAVCGVIGLALVRRYQARHWPGTALPPLQASTLSGANISLPDGRPVILHFWATWCGVCRAELASIQELAKEARVISVASLSGERADVERFVAQHRLNFDVIVDPKGELAERYGVGVYPTTYFVAADGDIIAREVGYVTPWGLKARWWLTQ